jgi:hypothetical protein
VRVNFFKKPVRRFVQIILLWAQSDWLPTLFFQEGFGPTVVSFHSFGAMTFFVPMNALAADQTRS